MISPLFFTCFSHVQKSLNALFHGFKMTSCMLKLATMFWSYGGVFVLTESGEHIQVILCWAGCFPTCLVSFWSSFIICFNDSLVSLIQHHLKTLLSYLFHHCLTQPSFCFSHILVVFWLFLLIVGELEHPLQYLPDDPKHDPHSIILHASNTIITVIYCIYIYIYVYSQYVLVSTCVDPGTW